MDTLFWVLSKVVWAVLSPDHFFILLLSFGFLALLLNRQRLAKWFIGLPTLAFLVITFLPINDWLLYPLESRFQKPVLPEHIDGIIVLGGAEDSALSHAWDEFVGNDGMERLTTTARLAKQFPNAKVVFSGGSGRITEQHFNESKISRSFLIEQGITPSRIQLEGASRNTFENVKNTIQVIQPQSDENWILVTSAFHMPRSVGIFNRFDWQVIPYPTAYLSRPLEYQQIGLPMFHEHMFYTWIGVREWIGLTVYYFTDKTSDWLPQPQANSKP